MESIYLLTFAFDSFRKHIYIFTRSTSRATILAADPCWVISDLDQKIKTTI